MIKPIKFRVWDSVRKTFLSLSHLYLNSCDDFIGAKSIGDSSREYYEISKTESDGYEIQQFTGLTDKEGCEIYEGDFVFVDELIWEVEFRLGCFIIIPIEDREGNYGYLHEYSKDCLVCGNKFEKGAK